MWLGLQIPEGTGGHGSKLTDDHLQNNGDVTATIVTMEQLIGDSPSKPHYWAELPFFFGLGLRSAMGLPLSRHDAETQIRYYVHHPSCCFS